MKTRDALVGRVADCLAAADVGHPLRVGIDGPCGSGKSTLARELVGAVAARGRTAIHIDSDWFHTRRDVRYRQGRMSARGYYEDAYDFGALIERVLVPLGPGGKLVYATKVHDLHTDAVVTDAIAIAPRDGVVVFDCTFLQRGQMRNHWDEVIYLQVDRERAIARGVSRDAQLLGSLDEARRAYEERYMAACDIYIREELPAERASILIDHNDLEDPRIVRCGYLA